MPETQDQIQALRAAFSEDLNRPFELKLSFPHGSPSERSRPSVSPPHETPTAQMQTGQLQTGDSTHYQQLQLPTSNMAYLTPPVSTVDSQPETPQTYPPYQPEMTPYHQIPPAGYHQSSAMLDASHWNPTPIIDQFNTAFAIPSSAFAPPQASANTYTSVPRPGNFDSSNVARQSSFDSNNYSPQEYPANYATTSQPQHYPQTIGDIAQAIAMPPTRGPQQLSPYDARTTSQCPAPGVTYVSAKDWQQSVATVLDSSGRKRSWQPDSYGMIDQSQKRLRQQASPSY